MKEMILISDVIREAKSFVSDAEDFIADHNRSYGYGEKCNLASNVKIYDYPDDDMLDGLLEKYNDDEKEIIRQAISEHKAEYADAGVQSLWQWFLEQQAEQLIEFVRGDMNDIKYYKKLLHTKPCSKNWKFYRRALIEEDMKQYCDKAHFAGRSGGWFMFGHSDNLNLGDIEYILSQILSADGKTIIEYDYEEMQYQTDDLWGFVRDGKEALEAFRHVSNFIARCKKSLVESFVKSELQYRIDEAISEYFSESAA